MALLNREQIKEKYGLSYEIENTRPSTMAEIRDSFFSIKLIENAGAAIKGYGSNEDAQTFLNQVLNERNAAGEELRRIDGLVRNKEGFPPAFIHDPRNFLLKKDVKIVPTAPSIPVAWEKFYAAAIADIDSYSNFIDDIKNQRKIQSMIANIDSLEIETPDNSLSVKSIFYAAFDDVKKGIQIAPANVANIELFAVQTGDKNITHNLKIYFEEYAPIYRLDINNSGKHNLHRPNHSLIAFSDSVADLKEKVQGYLQAKFSQANHVFETHQTSLDIQKEKLPTGNSFHDWINNPWKAQEPNHESANGFQGFLRGPWPSS